MRERATSIVTLAAIGAGLACLVVSWPHAPQPTSPPQSVNYDAPIRGQRVDLPGLAGAFGFGDGSMPTYLHFYNPRCSCAPATVEQLGALIAGNGEGARFVAVVDDRPGSVALARRQLASLGIPIITDPGGRMAGACGVLETPGAVIFDAQGRLFFRGGYGDTVADEHQASRAAHASDGDDPFGCIRHEPGITTVAVPVDGP